MVAANAPRNDGVSRRRSARACSWAGALVVLLCAGSAAAQDLPREEPDRARRESRAARRAASDAQRSALLPPLDPAREVRYEELLTDPDDIGLNYLFAQSQIRRGELRGASATLQRILMLRPELLRVRLLYAVVLYRLDNLIEAEREFRAIARLELPVSLRQEVAAYLDEIEIRSQRTRYGLGLTLGSQYDSNRNAAPSSGDVLFLDFRVPRGQGGLAVFEFPGTPIGQPLPQGQCAPCDVGIEALFFNAASPPGDAAHRLLIRDPASGTEVLGQASGTPQGPSRPQ